MSPLLEIKVATKIDAPIIYGFIEELAEFENLSHLVTGTESDLEKSLEGPKPDCEVIIAYWNQQPVGFALFVYNYSTFLAKRGIHLEDLYVKKENRGKGIGKALLKYLAKLAVERGCGRLEWPVLDWNTKAIGFYTNIGAVPMSEWTVYRVEGANLFDLASQNQ